MKNTGKKVLGAIAVIVVSISIGMMIGYDMKKTQIKNITPYVVKGYTPQEFNILDTLTANEIGAYILWDTTMSKELQVAYVTDSGTIEVLK
jgi:hypothetical protein